MSALGQVPDGDELVARASALRPLLIAHAPATDTARRLQPECVEALKQSGLFRIFTPKRYGGYEVSFVTYCRIVEALAQGCSSTGWVYSICNTGKWMGGKCRQELRAELFSDPDAIVCGSFKPTKDIQIRPDGVTLSGRWNSVSGAPIADWALFPIARDPTSEDESVNVGLAWVPMRDVRIEETWFVTGMSGTGTETVVVEDAFIPNSRLTSFEELRQTTGHEPDSPFAIPLAGPPGIASAMVVVGGAQAVIDLAVEHAPSDLPGYGPFQALLAEATLLTETARRHILHAAEIVDLAGRSGQIEERAIRHNRAAIAWSSRHALTAIDRIMTAEGPAAFENTSPYQRYWRNANTAARHTGLNPMVLMDVYGRALLGMEYDPQYATEPLVDVDVETRPKAAVEGVAGAA